MRRILGIFLVLTLLFAPGALAREAQEEARLYPFWSDVHGARQYGYIDAQGQVVVPPRFTAAAEFRDGMAVVRTGQLCNLIDAQGRLVLTEWYDDIYNFDSDFIYLQKDGKRMYRNRDGATFGEQWRSIDDVNGEIMTISVEAKEEAMGALYGYADREGNVVVEPKWGYASAFDCGRGWLAGKSPYEWMVAQPTPSPSPSAPPEATTQPEAAPASGTTPLPEAAPQPEATPESEATPLPEATAAKKSQWETQRFACVDAEGKTVFYGEYQQARPFSEDMAAVMRDGKWGYVDLAGKLTIDCQWDVAYDFVNGAAVVYGDKRYFYIGKGGAPLIARDFAYASSFDEEGRAIVCEDKKYGVIGRDGAYILEPTYDSIINLGRDSALFYSQREGGYGTVDYQGNWIVEPEWDWLYGFGDDVLCGLDRDSRKFRLFEPSERFGYVNARTGELLGEADWDYAEPFAGELAFAFRGKLDQFERPAKGEACYLDKSGRVVFSWASHSEEDYFGRFSQSGAGSM